MCRQIPILTYHRVHPDDETTAPGDLGRVDLTMFKRQMNHLATLGVETVTHHEIAAWLYHNEPVPERAVALDFDDNRFHILEHAFPIMAELGFRGTVFVVTDLAEGNPNIRCGMDRFPAMHWDHLRQLHEAGWCIAPHTVSHPIMAGPSRMVRDDAEIRHEMTESLRLVEQRIGVSAPYFAYPAGHWDTSVEAIAKRIFKTARLWQMETLEHWPVTTRETDPFRLIGINIAMNITLDMFCRIAATAQ